MKKTVVAVLLAIAALVVPSSGAQDKEKSGGDSKPAQTEREITPLRVQVVFTEFEGEKKDQQFAIHFSCECRRPRSTGCGTHGVASSDRNVEQRGCQAIPI